MIFKTGINGKIYEIIYNVFEVEHFLTNLTSKFAKKYSLQQSIAFKVALIFRKKQIIPDNTNTIPDVCIVSSVFSPTTITVARFHRITTTTGTNGIINSNNNDLSIFFFITSTLIVVFVFDFISLTTTTPYK